MVAEEAKVRINQVANSCKLSSDGGVGFEKIGESSFSEVFSYQRKDGGDSFAIKIIPLELLRSVIKDESIQPEPVPIGKALHEVKALLALASLTEDRRYAVPSGYTGFIRMESCALVTGPYPKGLLECWDEWKLLERNVCENTRPDHYERQAHFLIVEMRHAGRDLEAGWKVASVAQVRSIFVQLSVAVALAEERLSFEHRDL